MCLPFTLGVEIQIIYCSWFPIFPGGDDDYGTTPIGKGTNGY